MKYLEALAVAFAFGALAAVIMSAMALIAAIVVLVGIPIVTLLYAAQTYDNVLKGY